MTQSCVMIINISEAKAHVSKLVHLVHQGEEVMISNHNLPLVELLIHKPEKKENWVCSRGGSISIEDIFATTYHLDRCIY